MNRKERKVIVGRLIWLHRNMRLWGDELRTNRYGLSHLAERAIKVIWTEIEYTRQLLDKI